MPRRPTLEIETVQQFDDHFARGATSMSGWRLQDLDLRERGDVLRRLDPVGALFLGCRLDADVEQDLRGRGALVFPSVPEVPFDPYRATLYTPDELYDGLASGGYDATTDAAIHAWSRQHGRDLRATLAETLHDLSIDDALEDLVQGRAVVGVMGGHALSRGSADYRDAARLGRSLARAGFTVATGGGPGAMEAANLGSYLAGANEEALDEADAMLAAAPDVESSLTTWAESAFDVRRRWPDGELSLGVPTWFYGHEPPNAFADVVAKYFKNAVREDVLLHVCTAGVVFLPGRGGTVQEVFQTACENYYTTAGPVPPMVLVGTDFWTDELPAWPLLCALAEGREMQSSVHLVDDLEDAVGLLGTPGRLLR